MEKNFSAISRLPPATSIIRNRPKSNIGPPKEHWQKLIDESVYYKVLKYFKYIFYLIFIGGLNNLFSFKCPAYRSIATLPKYIDPKVLREPEDVKRNRSKSLAPKKTQRSEKPLRRYLCTACIEFFEEIFIFLMKMNQARMIFLLAFFASVLSKDIIISYRHKLGIRNSDRSTAKNAVKNFSQSTKLKSNFNFIEKKFTNYNFA